ncbi:MAG: monovalent cation/H(+) antiporter subunit G [Planctomycetota bacterium]
MSETLGLLLMGVGILFDLIGTIGLVRLPDVYNRLQAATKCVTLGTTVLLVGAALFVGMGALAMKAILCAAFILLTSPVGAHAIARGAHLSGIRLWSESVEDAYLEERKG